MTRRWTTFMGNTIALCPEEGEFDWFTAKSEELLLTVDGVARGLLELGGVEWSEECDQYAAVLVGRYSGSGLDVTVRNGAFHENAAFFRQVLVHNSSAAVVTIDRAVLEVLPIHHPRMLVMTDEFSVEHEAVNWKTSESAAVILAPRYSLLVGIEGGGRFELFDPDPETCALVCDDAVTLAPGEKHVYPETVILPFTGDVQEADGGAYQQYWKAREERIASLEQVKEKVKQFDGND
jgi:hypothetical protein